MKKKKKEKKKKSRIIDGEKVEEFENESGSLKIKDNGSIEIITIDPIFPPSDKL